MVAVPAILLLDDGELDDVREILAEIGAEYTHLRGAAIDGLEIPRPSDLLVTTARRAMMLGKRAAEGGDEALQEGPVRIVVVNEDSKTLRGRLRDSGYDYLVRRPVHPAALRLLILRALYRGPERRIASRVPIGVPVSFRMGLRRRPAVLVELASRGCLLFSRRNAEPDTMVTVQLPKEFTGDRALSLAGWVVRSDFQAPGARRGEFALAIAFEALGRDAEERLQVLLRDEAFGPEVLSEEDALRVGAVVEEASARDEGDRRGGQRGAFPRKVLALTSSAARVMVGRNLSQGGMMVGPDEEIRLGQRVRVAIFGKSREDPVVVRAQVVREENGDGLALRFLEVPPEDQQRLESLVASLPAVERLADGESEAMGTVVAEVLPDPEDPPAGA